MRLIEGVKRNAARDGFTSFDITAQENERGLMVVTGVVLICKLDDRHWLIKEQHEVNDEVANTNRASLVVDYQKFVDDTHDKAFG